MPGPCRGRSDLVAILCHSQCKCSEIMNADYGCDYWSSTQYAYHMYNRSNQLFNDVQKVNVYNQVNSLVKESTGGDYQGHLTYPSSYESSNSFQQVKEEPGVYNTCAYNNINQSYSNVDGQTNNSISPPPINHGFTNNLSQFDSCRQTYNSLATSLAANDSRPSSTFDDGDDSVDKLKTDDSPALRALLTRPAGKKIAYNYSDVHKHTQGLYQKQQFDGGFDEPKIERRFSDELQDKNTNDEPKLGDDNIAAVQSNFYPWMKSTHGNYSITIIFRNVLQTCL